MAKYDATCGCSDESLTQFRRARIQDQWLVWVVFRTTKRGKMVFRALIATTVAMASLGSLASATPVSGQISISGYAAAIGSVSVDAATGLDFTTGPLGARSPGINGAIGSYGAGYGSFAGLNCAGIGVECGTIKDIASFSAFTPLSNFLVFNVNGDKRISFDLGSITDIWRVGGGVDPSNAQLGITGSGIFHFTGYDDTAASFSLTTQAGLVTSFSATINALPQPVSEPASLGILGITMLTVGLIRYKKRAA